ncbi:hypothetical protein [Ruegeria lacuscaerulensis]|uniref:hypothetical protein n=1 Tax=Ruegeria lacuscaerulensis TaxID=55218 RepID=UPI00147F748E|nr:hypothetical protein [Ruegeria lacuscaerulensis]
MAKISFEEWVKLASDPSKRSIFKEFSTVQKGEGGFDFRIIPDPEKVEMGAADYELENAMQIGNNAERAARRFDFIIDRITSPSKPVIVEEGDSWHQFPFLIDEIIDHLSPHYAVLSLGAAGDTAANMVHGDLAPRKSEYLENLKAQKKHVKAFLFSAAGNDIIGEDPQTKKSALYGILRDFNGNISDVDGHIDIDELENRLDELKTAYKKVISNIRSVPELKQLPIFVHGYDYPFPYPAWPNDHRNPIYANNNEWLGEPFDQRHFPKETQAHFTLKRDILKVMINRLYGMLNDVANDPGSSPVHVIDCRNTLTDLNDWNDEIHGTDEGFKKIAARFQNKLIEIL